jgi:hypothetical protein
LANPLFTNRIIKAYNVPNPKKVEMATIGFIKNKVKIIAEAVTAEATIFIKGDIWKFRIA